VKRTAKCRQFDCDAMIEQEPLPFGGRVVWVPQLCPACQATDAKIRSEFAKKAHPAPVPAPGAPEAA
jgi:hypothetical protein